MRQRLMTAVLVAAGLWASPALASQTVYYPTQDDPQFSIVVPDNWTLEPAEEEGGFFSVNGPSGALLSFRAVEATEDGLKAAIEETIEWVKGNYKNVQIGEAQDAVENGLKGFNAAGTGNDKSDGHAVVFVMEWLELNQGLAEIWFCVNKGDQKGLDEAGKIAASIKAY